jgi:hypothetical protein
MAMQLIGVMDPRTAVQVLSRSSLREILLSKGKNIPPGETAERMRQLMLGENIDPSPYLLRTVFKNLIENKHIITKLRRERLGYRGNKVSEKPEAPIGTPPTETKPEAPKWVDTPKEAGTVTVSDAPPDFSLSELDGLKMPQLRQLAKRMGIKQSNTDKAADLLRKIKSHGEDTS